MAIAWLLILACSPAWAAETKDKKIPLKVIYAGDPGSERMKDFEQLLSKHFQEVGTANYEKFEASEADDFDVVILDWGTTYPRDENGKIDNDMDEMAGPKSVPSLSRQYNRPTVMIGATAGSVGRGNDIAINWK